MYLHPAKDKWNQKYQAKGPQAFGLVPSEWLASHRALILQQPKGLALDIACGNGRNSFFLAQMGFEVDAVDISEVAIEWLGAESKRRELNIAATCSEVVSDGFPRTPYQVILNFNFLERSLFPKMIASLAPGGLLFFETFVKDLDPAADTSMNPRFLLESNELLTAFQDLQVLEYREGDLGRECKGKKKVVASICARKKGKI